MPFISTRGGGAPVSLRTTLVDGLAPDGGLYVPASIEPLPASRIAGLRGAPLAEIGATIASHLAGDEIPIGTWRALLADALDFEIPLVPVHDDVLALELFHGPTLAFKDVGARVLARLLAHFHKAPPAPHKGVPHDGGGVPYDGGGVPYDGGGVPSVRAAAGTDAPHGRASSVPSDVGHPFRGAGSEDTRAATDDLTVLVATSGDTGGAVAHAFFGVPGTRVVVLYPDGQVSPVQEAQFATLGGNVLALAVQGTFDDCQRLVKEAFSDRALHSRWRLTSANSINVGRLLPQVFYYAQMALRMPEGARPLVAVPSGNFGNLTAGLIAQRLGFPIGSFVAATNINDTIPRFLATGRYEPAPSRTTVANAMDVGDPSNFERIRWLFGDDLGRMQDAMASSVHTDADVKAAIAELFTSRGYLCDPHGAVAYLGVKAAAASGSPRVFLATAHPAKFREVVEPVIGTAVPLPPALAGALDKPLLNGRIRARLGDVVDALTS